jgi:hypothetical protein
VGPFLRENQALGAQRMAGKKSSKARDASPSVPKKAPPPGKRYFLATMDADLIKDMKQAGIVDDKSASECLEIAAREWLERRWTKVGGSKGGDSK